MVTGITYHSENSRDDNNLPTSFIMVVTSQRDGVLFEDNTYTFKKSKSKLVDRIRANGDVIFNLLGDGDVAYCGKTKSFTFTGPKGTFFAKFVTYKKGV